MTTLRHNFERWAVGAAVATGGTPSGAGDDNLTVATVTGTGTKNAGNMPDGSSKGVYLYANDSASVATVGWTFASASNSEAVSWDMIVTALPGVAQRVLNTYDGGNGSSSPHLDITAGGLFAMMNSAHVAVATGAVVVPLNVRLHCQVYVLKGTTTSDGTAHMKVTRRDTSAVVFDSTLRTNIDADVTGFRGFQLGRPSTANWSGGFWIDNVAYDDTATGLIEAYVATTPVPSKATPLKQFVDYSTSTDASSLAASVTSGPAGFDATDITIAGLVASFDDTRDRSVPIVIDFTVTGPGGSAVDTVTLEPAAPQSVVRRYFDGTSWA